MPMGMPFRFNAVLHMLVYPAYVFPIMVLVV